MNEHEVAAAPAVPQERLQRVNRIGGGNRVWHNLLERDQMFTELLFEEADHLGLTTIEANTPKLTKLVARSFGH